jgi:hypothetical protein
VTIRIEAGDLAEALEKFHKDYPDLEPLVVGENNGSRVITWVKQDEQKDKQTK